MFNYLNFYYQKTNKIKQKVCVDGLILSTLVGVFIKRVIFPARGIHQGFINSVELPDPSTWRGLRSKKTLIQKTGCATSCIWWQRAKPTNSTWNSIQMFLYQYKKKTLQFISESFYSYVINPQVLYNIVA